MTKRERIWFDFHWRSLTIRGIARKYRMTELAVQKEIIRAARNMRRTGYP